MELEPLKQAAYSAFSEASRTLAAFVEKAENMEQLAEFSNAMAEILNQKGKILICGNGGSHCDALHFAEEFTGRYRKNRRALPVMALGEASHMSCVSNDFGFEEVFSRGVEAFGQEGDMLIGISTSGNSKNVIRALEEAKRKSMKTASLLGKDGGEMKGFSDYEWIVEAPTSDRVQEVHMMILHIAIELVERKLFPDHYSL